MIHTTRIKPTKKFYFMLAVLVLSITSILCGASLIGVSANMPLGTKLNLSVGSSIQLLPNQNGGYFLIQNYDSQTHIILLDNHGNILQKHNFDANYRTVCTSADYLYLLLDDQTADYDKSTLVYYNLAETSLINYQISTLDAALKTFTVTQNGTIYGIDYWNEQSLLAYPHISESGISTAIPLKTFDFALGALCTSPNDRLYIEPDHSNDFYIADAGQGLPYQFFKGASVQHYPSLPNRTLSNGVLLDKNQQLYRIHTDNVSLFSLLNDTVYTDACMLSDDSILCVPDKSARLDVISLNNSVLDSYTLTGECIAISANQNEVGMILKQQDSFYFVTLTELKNVNNSPPSSTITSSLPASSIPQEDQDNSDNLSKPDESISSNVNSDIEPDIIPNQLTSDRFSIDRSNNTIVLPPTTTFAVLRNNLNSTKDTIIVKNLSGTTISSGNLGTGYTVSLQINNVITDQLTIIVKGDLNGTGTVNSRDVLLLYNYLNKSESLTTAGLLASDLNNDDLIDTSDLLLLKQQIASEK